MIELRKLDGEVAVTVVDQRPDVGTIWPVAGTGWSKRVTRKGKAMGRRRRPNELRLMAALGVVAASAMVFTDGGLFGDVSNTPTGAAGAAELPVIQLHLSRADTAHFDRLYTHVVGPERNLQRYVEENTWRRAQLGYDGQVYDIRVKSHGRNPSDHSEMQAGWPYRFISLSIKLEAGHRIHGLNRFKLIVRSGFSYAAPIVSMAKHVGVFVQDHRLVRVQINNWPEHLFYFSNVLDDRYLESSGFGPFRRVFYDNPESAYSDHAMIYTDPPPAPYQQFDPAVFRGHFELALAQREIPEHEWEPLFQRYAAFNAAISGRAETETDPSEFLDLGYMQRYETARHVLGLGGHGFLYGNLRVLINTANGKFYPTFNRDNETNEFDLSEGRTPEFHINRFPHDATGDPRALPLFHYVATSDRLRQQVYRGIYEFIGSIEAGGAGYRRAAPGAADRTAVARSLAASRSRARSGRRERHGAEAGSTPPTDIFDDAVALNVESLRAYLEASDPEFSAQVAPEQLRLTIRPSSMSALRVETLEIGGDPGQRPVRVGVTEVRGAREHPIVGSYPAAVRADGTVDLGGALAEARFFTGLDLTQSAPSLPRVNIRWVAGLEEAQRRRLEQRLGLQNGTQQEGRTWRYDLVDSSARTARRRRRERRGRGYARDQSRGPDSAGSGAIPAVQACPCAAFVRTGVHVLATAARPAERYHHAVVRQHGDRRGGRGLARSPPSRRRPRKPSPRRAAFADSTDSFEDWASSHAALTPRRTGPREITLARGAYDLAEDLVFPSGYDVVIEGGTDLRLGPGVVMQVRGGLSVAGSAGNPVTVRPIDPLQPFGAVAVLGDGSQRTSVRYLDLSGGSDAWVRGARFSGALSIHYQREVEVSHASINDNHGDAGLSIKYARGRLSDSVFMGNRVAQVDLHYFDGVMRGNRLAGAVASGRSGRGLDATGSHLVATGNEFSGFMGSGVGVGESSEALLAANTFSDNALALAVTDLSTAYVHADNVFDANELDVSASMQKRHFGGGTVVLAGDTGPARMSVETDRVSFVVHVAAAAIERLRPSEIPAAGVVASLSELSVSPRR